MSPSQRTGLPPPSSIGTPSCPNSTRCLPQQGRGRAAACSASHLPSSPFPFPRCPHSSLACSLGLPAGTVLYSPAATGSGQMKPAACVCPLWPGWLWQCHPEGVTRKLCLLEPTLVQSAGRTSLEEG